MRTTFTLGAFRPAFQEEEILSIEMALISCGFLLIFRAGPVSYDRLFIKFLIN